MKPLLFIPPPSHPSFVPPITPKKDANPQPHPTHHMARPTLLPGRRTQTCVAAHTSSLTPAATSTTHRTSACRTSTRTIAASREA